MSNQAETMETLRACRDHWKTAFEHERENVIRLRKQLAIIHDGMPPGTPCTCRDCEIVRNPPTKGPKP